LVVLLAACGQSPSIMLSLDTATASVLRGGDVDVMVTLTRAGGASADVSLSVTGQPANVTAQFAPVTLSGGTLSSTLTLSAAAAAVAGSYDLVVTATGTGLADSADLTLEVTGLTVTGRVVSILEAPVAGVAVRSQGDSAITNADGSFTLTDLSVPYDLAIWNQADSWVQIYEGLTTADAVFSPIAGFLSPGSPRTATVSGNLTGGVIPVPANQVVMVCAEGIDGLVIGCDSVAPTESAYSMSVQWLGSATREIRVHALQVERDGAGYPVVYPGHGVATLTVTDTLASVANIDLGAALSTTTVDVDVVSPVAIAATIGAVQFGSNLAVPVAMVNSAAVAHEILMPVIADTTYTFAAAVALEQFGWQAEVTGSTATVNVPAPLLLSAPADLATNVTLTTDFSVSTSMVGPVTYMWDEDLGDLMVAVTTMAPTANIPDLAPYGLALPAGTDFSWQALGQSGDSVEAGIEGILDYYNFLLMLTQSSPGLKGEGSFAFTATDRAFTTAP